MKTVSGKTLCKIVEKCCRSVKLIRTSFDRQLSPIKKAKRQYRKRWRAIFEGATGETIDQYYNWYMAIERDSGD